MALVLTIGISLVLVVLALVGYLRDPRRSLMALLGTLVGAILVDFWGVQWGNSLAGRLVEGDPQRTTLRVSCLVFLWSALIVGYGGGALLGRSKELPIGQRLTGALLGLVNGLLIVGFLLRYATRYQPAFADTVKADLAANLINVGMPWLFLGAAIIVTVLSAERGALSLFGRRPAPIRSTPSPAKPAQPAPASKAPGPPAGQASAGPSPERRIDQREALDKIGERLR